ncbi:hypothetical protein AAFF_G00338520 [Aldrovandia affinis]|uniref:Uncharacterized protein n=1 Tax=Aldrovandia affinis TaxID=143900 RepID=A0AAD7R6E7_9TELE|nr:hypothetical protein AAFF_G00338520 [Aldrovandia affinis]
MANSSCSLATDVRVNAQRRYANSSKKNVTIVLRSGSIERGWDGGHRRKSLRLQLHTDGGSRKSPICWSGSIERGWDGGHRRKSLRLQHHTDGGSCKSPICWSGSIERGWDGGTPEEEPQTPASHRRRFPQEPNLLSPGPERTSYDIPVSSHWTPTQRIDTSICLRGTER